MPVSQTSQVALGSTRGGFWSYSGSNSVYVHWLCAWHVTVQSHEQMGKLSLKQRGSGLRGQGAGKGRGRISTSLNILCSCTHLSKRYLCFKKKKKYIFLQNAVTPDCFNKTYCIADTSWAQAFVLLRLMDVEASECSADAKQSLLHFRIPPLKSCSLLAVQNPPLFIYLVLTYHLLVSVKPLEGG